VVQLADAFNLHAFSHNQTLLKEATLSHSLPLGHPFEFSESTEHELLSSTLLKDLVEAVFDREHYLPLAREYNSQEGQHKPLFVYLLPLANYYNARQPSAVTLWVQQHLPCAVDWMGGLLAELKLHGRPQEDTVNDFVSCLELLVRYKQ
jgi:hypothetical protein